jgi:hypothetical protein
MDSFNTSGALVIDADAYAQAPTSTAGGADLAGLSPTPLTPSAGASSMYVARTAPVPRPARPPIGIRAQSSIGPCQTRYRLVSAHMPRRASLFPRWSHAGSGSVTTQTAKTKWKRTGAVERAREAKGLV